MIGGQRRRIRIEDALASVPAFHNRRTQPCNLNSVNNCRAYDYMTMADRKLPTRERISVSIHLDASGKMGNFRGQLELRPGVTLGASGWSMKFPYERRSTRLGPSIWRRIATSTLRTADGAYLSAICNGSWRPVKARLKCSRVPDLDRLPKDEW
jgi:hypothetical protein